MFKLFKEKEVKPKLKKYRKRSKKVRLPKEVIDNLNQVKSLVRGGGVILPCLPEHRGAVFQRLSALKGKKNKHYMAKFVQGRPCKMAIFRYK